MAAISIAPGAILKSKIVPDGKRARNRNPAADFDPVAARGADARLSFRGQTATGKKDPMRPLEIRPASADPWRGRAAYGVAEAQIAASPEFCDRMETIRKSMMYRGDKQ
jgi:hypothetical protein